MDFHQVATDGWVVDGEEEEREVMKSETIARWEGLNFPYQIKLMEILPVRRGPLWYWNSIGCWVWSEVSEMVLAAELKWTKPKSWTSCRSRYAEEKAAMVCNKEMDWGIGSLLLLEKIYGAQVFVGWIIVDYEDAYL